MTGRELLKKSPNLIIGLAACGTFLAVAVLAAMVVLSLNGGDTEVVSRFVNTILNFVTIIVTSGAAVAAGAAAKNSAEARETAQKAVEQTNGPITDLTAKVDRLSE